MQAKNNKSNDDLYNFADMQELAEEAPIGWSATCLDQTICYYLDCNQEYSAEPEDSN